MDDKRGDSAEDIDVMEGGRILIFCVCVVPAGDKKVSEFDCCGKPLPWMLITDFCRNQCRLGDHWRLSVCLSARALNRQRLRLSTPKLVESEIQIMAHSQHSLTLRSKLQRIRLWS